LITDQLLEKLARQQPLNLVANLGFVPACLRLVQLSGESPQRLQNFAEAGAEAVQLLAGKGG
jgi:hypothetical protein